MNYWKIAEELVKEEGEVVRGPWKKKPVSSRGKFTSSLMMIVNSRASGLLSTDFMSSLNSFSEKMDNEFPDNPDMLKAWRSLLQLITDEGVSR